MSDEVTNAGFKKNVLKVAKKLSNEHSPDLSKLVSIDIEKGLTVHVTKEKLDKFGKQYFIDKYLTNKPVFKKLAENDDENLTNYNELI